MKLKTKKFSNVETQGLVNLAEEVGQITQNLSDRVQKRLKKAEFWLWGQNDRLSNTGKKFLL